MQKYACYDITELILAAISRKLVLVFLMFNPSSACFFRHNVFDSFLIKSKGAKLNWSVFCILTYL